MTKKTLTRKTNHRVTHVGLNQVIQLRGKDLRKSICDSTESPGINMQLDPAGVLCELNGEMVVIPYARCNTIALAKDDAPEATKEKK